jgi:hypothetical protein
MSCHDLSRSFPVCWRPIAGIVESSNERSVRRLEEPVDDDKLREAAHEEVEALPAETAAGNVDADSDGAGTEFPDSGDGSGEDTSG